MKGSKKKKEKGMSMFILVSLLLRFDSYNIRLSKSVSVFSSSNVFRVFERPRVRNEM